MKYIDFGIQTLLLALFLVASIIGIFESEAIGAVILAAMYVAMFLGPWQMLSSFLSIVLKSQYHKLKRIHFFSSLLYFILLSFFIQLKPDFPDWLISILSVIPVVALALFYYSLTWRWMFHTESRSSFLPNTNF
jgi:hypothetical protein